MREGIPKVQHTFDFSCFLYHPRYQYINRCAGRFFLHSLSKIETSIKHYGSYQWNRETQRCLGIRRWRTFRWLHEGDCEWTMKSDGRMLFDFILGRRFCSSSIRETDQTEIDHHRNRWSMDAEDRIIVEILDVRFHARDGVRRNASRWGNCQSEEKTVCLFDWCSSFSSPWLNSRMINGCTPCAIRTARNRPWHVGSMVKDNNKS